MGDNRVKKSAQNMVTGFAYHAITLILSFVSRTVFIQTLGDEYLGLNGIFTDVLSLLSMADLGFNTAMAYSFYKPLADRDEKQIASLVAFYKRIYNVIAIAVLVLGVACIPFLDYIIKTEEEIPNLVIYYLFSLANVVISYMFVYKTTLLTADQKDYKVVRIRIVTSLAKTVLQIAVLYIARDYIMYLAIGMILQIVNNVATTVKTEKEYPFIKDKKLIGQVDKKVTAGIVNNMKSVFVYKLSGTLFSFTDNIIISMVINTAMVGIYSNYLMVSSKLLLIEQIIFSALTASIGNVIVKESAKKKYEVFSAMQSASFIFCGIITSVFGLMANDLVKVWLGESRMLDSVTVIAVTLNTYLTCVLQPLWVYRDATGLYTKTKYAMLAGAILNIVLSFVLGKAVGIAGIIFASAISRLTTYFWYEPKLLFKEYFDRGVGKYYLSLLANLLIVLVTTFLLGIVTKGFVVSGWGSLIVKGSVIGVVCSAVFMLAYARTEGFKIILDKVMQIIKRK